MACIILAGCLGSVYSNNDSPNSATGKSEVKSIALYITLDPVGQHIVGETFTITGTTNLPKDQQILVEVLKRFYQLNQGWMELCMPLRVTQQ
jgi:hypothetical protein